jgi:hypothetical protein
LAREVTGSRQSRKARRGGIPRRWCQSGQVTGRFGKRGLSRRSGHPPSGRSSGAGRAGGLSWW